MEISPKLETNSQSGGHPLAKDGHWMLREIWSTISRVHSEETDRGQSDKRDGS